MPDSWYSLMEGSELLGLVGRPRELHESAIESLECVTSLTTSRRPVDGTGTLLRPTR
jgi:hypothetical protein